MVIRPTQPFHVSTLRRPLRHRAEEGGWGVGREAEGQIRLVSGQRSLLLLVTQETPLTRVRITDVRGNSHRPLTSSPPWEEVFLPACLQRDRKGGRGRAFLWRWPALKSLDSKTLHRARRFTCSGVGWGGVGWGGDGGLLRTPPVFPPLDTCLEPMKS
jgi:hypothetical protein